MYVYVDIPMYSQYETNIHMKSTYVHTFNLFIVLKCTKTRIYIMYTHTYVHTRAETICLFVILHIATSNIAIYCIIAILVYNFM